MAALAIVGAMMSSCAEEIEVAQPANTDKTVMVKTTVSLDENGSTRALTEAGVKTFAVGEQIAVIYKNTSDETVKVESVELKTEDIDNTNAHNATFSVPLTNPKPGGAVRYIYPASRAAETVATDAAVNASATVNYAALATQDGTFAKASTLDLATFDGTLTESGTLPATVTLANPLTIVKFTIKESGSDITEFITSLNISDGTNTYAVTRTPAAGPIYVAMQAVSSQTVTVNAFTSDAHYTKSVADKTLAASNIYDITVNTTPGANLSLVTADYTAQYGEVLTGTLGSNVKIIIADGMTVTLNNVTINGVDNSSYNWAGITCEGDATIILANGSTNTVKGFSSFYPGIFIPVGNTLTIQGDGSLDASNNGGISAGIGAGYGNNCGNIEIQGGNITATSSEGAGIGAGQMGKCGNITISGGTITATSSNGAGIGGGDGGISDAGQCGNITISGGTITATSSHSGAGIGGGDEGHCGDITITNGVTKVTATKGSSAQQCIGKGETSDCGTVTFGTATVYTGSDWTPSSMVSGSYGGLNLAISTTTSADDTWTLSYNAHSVTNAVPGDLGKLIGADGKIYINQSQVSAAGTTAVAVIAYVGDAGSADASSTTYKGLALALTDANGGSETIWCTQDHHGYLSWEYCLTTQYDDGEGDMAGIGNTNYLIDHAPTGHNHVPASAARNYNSGTHPTGTSAWFLPSDGQWAKMVSAAGGYQNLKTNASLQPDRYWTSTEWKYDGFVWLFGFSFNYNGNACTGKDQECYVRSALAF